MITVLAALSALIATRIRRGSFSYEEVFVIGKVEYNAFMSKGKLTQNGVHLEEHEYRTVKYLLELGYDIELIPPLRIEGVKTADISMNGIMWEMKAPQGGGKTTLRHTVKHAVTQSGNLIIDLRRCRIVDDQAVKELKKHFKLSKRIRRMIIIKKDEKILDYYK